MNQLSHSKTAVIDGITLNLSKPDTTKPEYDRLFHVSDSGSLCRPYVDRNNEKDRLWLLWRVVVLLAIAGGIDRISEIVEEFLDVCYKFLFVIDKKQTKRFHSTESFICWLD